jgi:hypothetical protein
MSDMLTHWATYDDCCRLAQLDETIAPDFRRLLVSNASEARFGTLTRGGGVWMEPTLRNAMARWNDPAQTQRNERNVAFVLGGLIHQSCDRVMKPLLTKAGGDDWSKVIYQMQGSPQEQAANAEQIAKTQEGSAYFDAEVFRQVYLGGSLEPFNSLFLAEASPAGESFEAVIKAMFQRTILTSHTLKPEMDNMEVWLDNLFDRVQALPLKIERWVQVFKHGDPAKAKALGVDEGFYNPKDPLIQAARLLQGGKPLEPALKRQVYEEGASTCAYGDVLQTGLVYLRSASAFWRGEVKAFSAPNYIKQHAS